MLLHLHDAETCVVVFEYGGLNIMAVPPGPVIASLPPPLSWKKSRASTHEGSASRDGRGGDAFESILFDTDLGPRAPPLPLRTRSPREYPTLTSLDE